MNSKYVLIFILVFVLAIFVGCSKASDDAEQMTKVFLTQFYNFDYEKSDEILKPLKSGEILKQDYLDSVYNEFKPLMTDEALKTLLANRTYFRNILFCSNNNCSLKIKQLDLNKTFYDKKERKIGFNYVASIEIIYENGKRKEVEEEKGYVGLIETNDKWKVYSNIITSMSKEFFM